MATARAIGLVCVVLLGYTGPASAPSWSPARDVAADAPTPCAPLAANVIELGCAQQQPSGLGASFLDAEPLRKAAPIHDVAELLARGEELVAADRPTSVPEPSSLLLMALGCGAFGIAPRAHARSVDRPR